MYSLAACAALYLVLSKHMTHAATPGEKIEAKGSVVFLTDATHHGSVSHFGQDVASNM